jgi:hypothetical protein
MYTVDTKHKNIFRILFNFIKIKTNKNNTMDMLIKISIEFQ